PHPPTSQIYTLSLHDALPIYSDCHSDSKRHTDTDSHSQCHTNPERDSYSLTEPHRHSGFGQSGRWQRHHFGPGRFCFIHSEGSRSEEHTSELQSQSNLVCRLL